MEQKYESLIKTKDLERDEWLEYRRTGIGGSDLSAICGMNKYRSAYEVYLDKTGKLERPETAGEAAHFGTILEEIVAREFSRVTGKKVRRKNMILRSKDNGFMIADLDRMIVVEKAFLECNTASAYLDGAWKDDKIPDAYMLQIQHYMEVTGFQYCYIACLIGGNKFVWKKVERDNGLIKNIVELEKDFWLEHVLKNIPPDISGSGSDSALLSILYPDSRENIIRLGSSADEIIEELNRLKEQAKELDEKITGDENLLKSMLGENEAGETDKALVTWKSITSSRVDSRKLQSAYPEIYKDCIKQSSYRKFTVRAKEVQ